MNQVTTNPLDRILRECELGWLVDWHAPPEQAIETLHAALAQATAESERRFGDEGPRFDDESLEVEYQKNPHKIRAFLQALAATRNPQMLLATWRIMQGTEIAEVDMTYRAREEFRLRLMLRSGQNAADEVYESTDISDAALLRHFGIAKSTGGPLFDGFYPLRIR